MYKVEENMNIK